MNALNRIAHQQTLRARAQEITPAYFAELHAEKIDQLIAKLDWILSIKRERA